MECSLDPVISPPLLRIRVTGDLDLFCAAGLRTAVGTGIAVGCDVVVVDLGDVTFIDCAGIGALLGCLADITAAHGSFSLGTVSTPVARLFELTGTRARFTLAQAA